MNIKSILTKSVAVAALSVAGITAVNATNNHEAQAAVVENDTTVYTVHQSTTVYNNYENGVATGQVLAANTSWKVIKTAYDAQGNKWYDLGKNQWVKVPAQTTQGSQAVSQAPTSSQNTTSSNYSQNNSANTTQTSYTNYSSNTTTTSNVSYTSSATGSEASAKAWIAGRESGDSYSARNGQYIGKYQLSASYLNGDYSAANQEKVADNYVKSRYGSWTAAKSFWQANGWY